MITGNKGEWSEIYVFLKLLAEGRLYAADEGLNAIPNIFYPILKIIRDKGTDRHFEYSREDEVVVLDNFNNKIASFPIIEFLKQSKSLFESLKEASGASFGFPEVETFLNKINISSIKAGSGKKSDINIVVHDLNTGMKPELGFSIKSLLGKSSTLLNAGNTTNFIFDIAEIGQIDVCKFNSIDEPPKIASRIKEIEKLGLSLTFSHIESSNFELNLQLIDGSLPVILAESLLIASKQPGKSLVSKVLLQLVKKNPLNFNLSKGHPFYQHKMKSFLTDCALGMTPATVWTGNYDATGGIIIVKQDGEILCYHIYNREQFQNYLLENTRFEQASTTRYNYGECYDEDGKTKMKLNLQIRFD